MGAYERYYSKNKDSLNEKKRARYSLNKESISERRKEQRQLKKLRAIEDALFSQYGEQPRTNLQKTGYEPDNC
jgi:hypothetical protein